MRISFTFFFIVAQVLCSETVTVGSVCNMVSDNVIINC